MFKSNALNPSFSLDQTQIRALKYVSDVYLRMTLALAISAVIGYLSLKTGLLVLGFQSLGSGFSMAIFATQILTVIAFNDAAFKMKSSTTQYLFIFYACITGLTFGLVGLLYTLDSIVTVGLATAVGFASLVSYGKLTRRDLGPIGTFCTMGITMLMAFSLIVWLMSFFSPSSALFSTSMLLQGLLGTVLFAGLTAYESQRLKQVAKSLAEAAPTDAAVDTFVNAGALRMYMNFVGMFLSLLRLLGGRR